MLRKCSLLLCMWLLSACTLAPETTPTPLLACPTCAAAAQVTTAPCGATQTPLASTLTATPRPSATQTGVPPTVTRTSIPTSTKTPAPTATRTRPPATATLPAPTATTRPSATSASTAMTYQVQSGSPRLIQNFAHPELGCNWLGVAGQAFDLDGAPVSDLVVLVSATVNGAPTNLIGLTGSSPVYGPAGYEIQISTSPAASPSSLFIQLFDLNSAPLSYPVAIDTSTDCTKNLVLVNFKQVK